MSFICIILTPPRRLIRGNGRTSDNLTTKLRTWDLAQSIARRPFNWKVPSSSPNNAVFSTVNWLEKSPVTQTSDTATALTKAAGCMHCLWCMHAKDPHCLSLSTDGRAGQVPAMSSLLELEKTLDIGSIACGPSRINKYIHTYCSYSRRPLQSSFIWIYILTRRRRVLLLVYIIDC